MNNQNPATPAPAATPGSDAQNSNPTPAATPAPTNTGDQGNNQEGKVTIGTKEFAQLTRDAARGRSSKNRSDFNFKNNNKDQPIIDENTDPQASKIVKDATDRADAAERETMQLKVRDGVRGILDKDEFKNLPKSTRELILKNPALLSKADNLEEALLDIEEFVRDEVVGIDIEKATNPVDGVNPQPNPQPEGHQAPPVIGSGAPAPTVAAGIEDVSRLTGSARSQAMIRNKMRETKGVKQVT